MTDFKVVLEDLSTLASRYSDEAKTYEGVAGKLKLTPPDSGDGTLNTSMELLLGELSALNAKLAASLEMYSEKISKARSAYEITDDDDKNRFLYDNMMSDIQ